MVVPVVTTGLHCGVAGAGSVFVTVGVVPVVTTGLHCGGDMFSQLGFGADQVVPVVTTGLHCGADGDGRPLTT